MDWEWRTTHWRGQLLFFHVSITSRPLCRSWSYSYHFTPLSRGCFWKQVGGDHTGRWNQGKCVQQQHQQQPSTLSFVSLSPSRPQPSQNGVRELWWDMKCWLIHILNPGLMMSNYLKKKKKKMGSKLNCLSLRNLIILWRQMKAIKNMIHHIL